MGEREMVPCWRVESYWRNSIVFHLVGWQRTIHPEEEKGFRSEMAARRYAERITGVPSFLVPYMSRKGVVVEGLRPLDWRDRLSRWILARLSHPEDTP